MVSTGAGRYITDRWSIAAEAGNTWFLYDYRQKTIPNQYLPLDSNVSNLKNNLISAGVKVGFHTNENLSFYAGANLLNPFHSGQSSCMLFLQFQHTIFLQLLIFFVFTHLPLSIHFLYAPDVQSHF